jgi:uncharacterized protein with NRDE domain
MCLITLAYRCHPDYPLLVAANRDEFYRRPTAAAQFWAEAPRLLAGRDLEAGGTWMGITECGRFAAVTNHRNPPSTPPKPRSRGMLTLDYLLGAAPAPDYLQSLARRAGDYAGFNLVLADHSGLFYFSNVENRLRRLPPGVYSLSNALLDANWPKQRRAARALAALIPGAVDHGELRATVSDRTPATDEELPDTGIGRELERALSSQFIVTGDYGTRATTTLAIHRSRRVEFLEQSFKPGGTAAGLRRYAFRQTASPGARG